ncbi:hypothetical protein ACIPC1_34635 [Streptomyces sp. NPDC087263]|uniref:hypothetical protein n=1 Tax=Streptomyces sp. NPDC087263 TaxID=3365773 RepID=UPI003829A651
MRGEVLMTNRPVRAQQRGAHGGQPFANPRDATAGTLRAVERIYTMPTRSSATACCPYPRPRRRSKSSRRSLICGPGHGLQYPPEGLIHFSKGVAQLLEAVA